MAENKQQVEKAIAEVEKAQTTGLFEMIEKSSKELGKALPKHLSPERLVRIALTTIRLNPELMKCTPESFLGSLFVLAQLGLEPIGGRAYLLPFNNSRKINGEWKTIKEVQAVIGYKGITELFYRHESSLVIDMHEVCKKDKFDYEYGTDAYLNHKPNKKDRGEVIGYYAIAKLKGCASLFLYMAKADCMAHAKKHSKTFDKKTGEFYPSSPWAKDTDSMCKKTVLLQLAKTLPLSIEMQKAIQIDETSRSYKEGAEDYLDIPDTINWNEGETKKIEGTAIEPAEIL